MHRSRTYSATVAALVSTTLLASCAAAQSGSASRANAAPAAERYDVLIRGGRLLDGTGNPWVSGDVGIRGDRIVAVGNLAGATATTVLDAEGRYIAPGFIDTHSHSGGALETRELSSAHQLLAQGITTVLANPDGGGRVDLVAQRRDLIEHGLGVNVGLMVPHGAVRQAVIGMEDRAPTAAEMTRMEGLVRAGMEAGAFGMSSGPFYAPGSYARTDELVALARVTAPYGAVYQSHIRDEGDYTIGVVAAVDEVITVAREAGVRGVVTHIKALGPRVWGYSAALVNRIDRARLAGTELFADQYPYEASQTSLAAALVPRWAQAGGRNALAERLASGADQERLLADMTENLERRGGAARIQIGRYGADSTLEGMTLAQIAERRGTGAVATAVELLRAGDASIVSFNMSDEDIERLMVQPWTMTSSDGGLVPLGQGVPHPRGNGAFARKLRKYVAEDQVVELSSAIRSMTSLPGSVYRVPDRGLLRPGAYADVVVFDLDAVRDNATFENPHQVAEGMSYVIVNGQVVIRDGALAGPNAGRLLDRRP